jgi:hypothetical protein
LKEEIILSGKYPFIKQWTSFASSSENCQLGGDTEHLQPLRISVLDYFELAKLVKPGKNSF